MLLAWSRDLTRCSYEYRVIDEQFTVTWNHTTFARLGLYYAGRYFDRHFGLAEAKEWLRRSRLGFAAQARSWKPQEDADSYLVLTMGHTIEFSLADYWSAHYQRSRWYPTLSGWVEWESPSFTPPPVPRGGLFGSR